MKKRMSLALSLALGLGSQALAATEITFLYGLGGPLGERVVEMVNAFNKSQNDVVVRAEHAGNYDLVLQKALAGIAAGQPAGDVLQLEVSLFTRLADAGQLADLSKMPGFMDQYNSLWGVFKNQAKRPTGFFASPWNNSVPVLYANQELLKKAGVNSIPKTWVELRDAARKIKAATGVPAVNLPADTWLLEAGLLSNGVELIKNGRLQLDQPGALEVLNFWQGMMREGNVMMDGPNVAAEFASGRLAMRFASVASRTELNQTIKFPFTAGPVPYFKTPGVTTGGAVLAIPKAVPAARQQAAWKFISWLNQPAQQATWIDKTFYLPVSRATVSTPEFQAFLKSGKGLDAGYRQLPGAKPRPTAAGYPQAQPEIVKALQEMYLRNAPVEATMKSLADRTAPLFKDVK